MTYRTRGPFVGILFLAVALTPVAAVSGPFEDGMVAYDSADYATALQLWQSTIRGRFIPC